MILNFLQQTMHNSWRIVPHVTKTLQYVRSAAPKLVTMMAFAMEQIAIVFELFERNRLWKYSMIQ